MPGPLIFPELHGICTKDADLVCLQGVFERGDNDKYRVCCESKISVALVTANLALVLLPIFRGPFSFFSKVFDANNLNIHLR